MSTSNTTWRIPPAAWIPIGLAFGAEAYINASRGYDLGSHLAEQTVVISDYSVSLAGIGCVIAALALSSFQSIALWAALSPGRDWRQRILAVLTALLLLLISVSAMASHMLHAERAAGSDDTTEQKAYDQAEAALKRASANYEAVKDAPTVDAVEAQIAALKIDANIWRRTKECNPLETIKKSVWQDECKPFAKLQKPLADARRKAELEAALPSLEADLKKIKRPELATGAEEQIGKIWGWAVAFGIVLVATAGPALAAKPVPAINTPVTNVIPDNSGNSVPAPIKPDPNTRKRRGRRPRGNVSEFAAAYQARHGHAPSGKEIRAEFPELPKSTAYDYASRTRASG